MTLAFRDRVEAVAAGYFKRLWLPAAAAISLAGFLGWKSVADIRAEAETLKASVKADLTTLKADVDDKGKAVKEELAASKSAIGSATSEVHKRADAIADKAREIESTASKVAQAAVDAGRAKDDVQRASGLVKDSTQAVTEALKLSADVAKLMPQASTVDRLTRDAGRLLQSADGTRNKLEELSAQLQQQLADTRTLRADLDKEKNLNRSLRQARTLQIVMLRADNKSKRTIRLPGFDSTGRTVQMTLGIPSGLGRSTFDLEFKTAEHGEGILQGLAVGGCQTIGRTGYQVEVEYLFHDKFSQDFALMKIQPVVDGRACSAD